MPNEPPITLDQIRAAAPLCAPRLSPERLEELAPKVQAVLTTVARLDDLDLEAYEPGLSFRLPSDGNQ